MHTLNLALCEFEANPVYKVCSRTARDVYREKSGLKNSNQQQNILGTMSLEGGGEMGGSLELLSVQPSQTDDLQLVRDLTIKVSK